MHAMRTRSVSTASQDQLSMWHFTSKKEEVCEELIGLEDCEQVLCSLAPPAMVHGTAALVHLGTRGWWWGPVGGGEQP